MMGTEVIDGSIDHDLTKPKTEGARLIKLPDLLQGFEKAFVQNFSGFTAIARVTQADTHRIAIKMFKQLPLAVAVGPDATLKCLLKIEI
jgi:hypothetical protein